MNYLNYFLKHKIHRIIMFSFIFEKKKTLKHQSERYQIFHYKKTR